MFAVSGAESAAQARDLLQRLLCKDPALRLGGSGGGGGYADIMAHPWFADIDWSALNNVSPPW